MAKGRRNYREIYDVFKKEYKLDNADSTDWGAIQRQIRRKVTEEFGDQEWKEISPIDKDFFIYSIEMQNYFKNFNCWGEEKEKVFKEIEEKFKALEAPETMLYHNELVSLDPYFTEKDSKEKKQEAFERYKNHFRHYNRKDPDETFEEWSQKPSLRPYDLYKQAMEIVNEEMEKGNCIDYPVRDTDFINSEITRYTIKTICDALKKKFGITIDTKLIEECVTFVYDYNVGRDSAEPFQLEYDPDLIKKEEQKKAVNADCKYAACCYKLRHLKFWKDEDNGQANEKSGSSR